MISLILFEIRYFILQAMRFKMKPSFKSCWLARTCHILFFQKIGYIYIIDFIPIRKIHIISVHGKIEVLLLFIIANLSQIHRPAKSMTHLPNIVPITIIINDISRNKYACHVVFNILLLILNASANLSLFFYVHNKSQSIV